MRKRTHSTRSSNRPSLRVAPHPVARAARATCEQLEARSLMSTSVYANDFLTSTGSGSFSAGSVQTSPLGEKYLGSLGGGTGTTLGLTGLTVGDVLHVSLSVYTLNQWDGSSGGGFAITAGPAGGAAATLLASDFAQNSSVTVQSYPLPSGGGTSPALQGVSAPGLDVDGSGGSNDARYDMSFDVPVVDASMELTFDAACSGFGLDSVTVTADPVAPLAPSGGRLLGEDAAGVPSAAPGVLSSGVRGADGTVTVNSAGLSSSGFGLPWGHSPTWTNAPGYSRGGENNGNGWVLSELPTIAQSGNAYVVKDGGTDTRWFDADGGGTFTPRFHTLDKLTHDSDADEYRLVDTTGTVTTFYDFTVSPSALRGKLKGFTSAEGEAATVTYDVSGNIESVERTDGTTTETFAYTYSSGRISLVEQQRNSVTFRQIAYTYYGSSDEHGNAGDLKFAVLQDGGGNEIDRYYYRYFMSDDPDIANGYVGGLKMAFGPQAYARLAAANPSNFEPDSLADAAVVDLVDTAIKYGVLHAATQIVSSGGGCGCGTASNVGVTNIPQPFVNPIKPTGPNDHKVVATEVRPDGSTLKHYLNAAGQPVLTELSDGTTTWRTGFVRDAAGRVIRTAEPGTVTGTPNPALPNLGNDYSSSCGAYALFSLTTGRIVDAIYYTGSTATDSVAGGAAGFLKSTESSRGQYGAQAPAFSITHSGVTATFTSTSPHGYSTGQLVSVNGANEAPYNGRFVITFLSPTAFTYTMASDPGTDATPLSPSAPMGAAQVVVESATEYIRRASDPDPDADVIYLPARITQFRDPGATGGQTTEISRTWCGGFEMSSESVSDPIVTSDQNGPGGSTHDQKTTGYNPFGQIAWVLDAIGRLTTFGRDVPTGAMTSQTVDDNPCCGGLVIESATTVDELGRPLESTDPNGNKTYNIYKDALNSITGAAREVRTYRGWNATTGLPTGPVSISREVRPAADSDNPVFTESLTSEAVPATAGSSGTYVPTGGEAVGGDDVKSLSRSYQNSSGQVDKTDAYHSMSGLTSLTAAQLRAADLGSPSNDSASGNYSRTITKFDHVGRPARTISPTGTVTYQAHDVLGRVTAIWTGTSDAGFTHSDPSNGGANGLIKVAENEYDNGGEGVGDLTKSVVHPTGSTNSTYDRVTLNYFDWRHRLVATKSGDQGGTGESGDAQRPIAYYVYDNLGNVVRTDAYDGDQETISTSAGVPQPPSSSKLRARTATKYDEQNRPYQTAVYSVNPSTGAVSSTALTTNTWYDRRGLVIKTSQPGGLVTKTAYDNAGRVTVSYQTDGGGDSSWSDADDVSGDKVLEQVEHTYDDNGNVLLTVARQRFDGETGTGALGTLSTGVKARVTHAATWYDAIDRVTDSADLGTIYGSAATFPLAEGGFETPDIAVNNFAYGPSGSAWTFTSTAGISDNNSGFTSGNPNAPEGSQVLVVQGVGTAAQTVSGVTAGTYVVKFKAAQRGNYHVADQSFEVRVDGDVVGTFTPSSTSYAEFVTAAFRVPAGSHSIEFRGLDVSTVHTAFVDDVRIEEAAAVIPNVPDRSDSALVTSYTYDDAGNLEAVTNPKGIVTHTGHDLLGRATKVVESYVDGTPDAGDTDRVTAYTYDGVGHVLTMTALLPDGPDSGSAEDVQTTRYVYGVTTAGPTIDSIAYPASAVNSNDVLQAVRYPDKSAGTPGTGSGDREVYTVNALGEPTTFKDKNGSVHAYEYDVLGRTLSDAVTTLASGVNGTVRRLQTSYNTQGLPQKFTSYNASSGGSVVNEVERAYNGLGQLTTEYQAHDGAVNTSTTPKVQYAYTEMASGANHSRLKSMTYPGGRVVRYQYNSGLDDGIGRLSYIADDAGGSVGTHLEEYAYLGLGTVVSQKHPEPNLDLSYVKRTGESDGTAGDKYAGLDRFGRVVDQRWLNPTTGTAADRFVYGYDANSNVLYKDNKTSAANSEMYHADGTNAGYDQLDRLTGFQRGALVDADSNGVPDSTASSDKGWTLDPLGNWTALTTTTPGPTTTTDQTRTHNAGNQLTGSTDAGGSPTAAHAYDAAGSLKSTCTTSGYCWFSACHTYDAWNRQTYDAATACYASAASEASYRYDALGRRIVRTEPTTDTGIVACGTSGTRTTVDRRTDLYYSARWQVVDDRAAATTTNYCYTDSGGSWTQTGSTSSTATVDDQYVWGEGYVDDLVLRDRSGTGVVTPDTTFDTDGLLRTDFNSGTDDVARAVAVQPDGKIVAAGTTVNGSASDLAVARYNADGSLDTSFDGDGKVTSSLGTAEGYGAIDLEVDGDILVGGFATVFGNGKDFLLARYNPDGSPDTGFDGDGFVTTDFGGGNDQVRAVAELPDGSVVAVGDAVVSSVRKLAVARYTAAGALDTTFGTGGKVTLAVGTGGADGYGLVVQPDGKLVIAGYASSASTGTDMVAVRLNPDGSLDSGTTGDTNTADQFGTAGVATIDFNGSDDHAYAVALAPDGSLVLAGDAAGSGGSTTYMAAARLTPDGTLDTTYGSSGKLTTFTAAGSVANAVAVDGLGRATLAGSVVRSGSERDVAIARLSPDGSADATFGSSGRVQTNFATNRDDAAYAVTLTTTGGAVVAGGSITGGVGDFAVARYRPGGTATQRLYALQDVNFNVTALADAAGNVVQRFRYDPYGASTVVTANWGGTTSDGYGWLYRHQGGRLEAATGTYHFRNRDYDAVLGRWLQEDPAGYADGMSLTVYLAGNPLKYTDPLGLVSTPTTRPAATQPSTQPDPADLVAGPEEIHQDGRVLEKPHPFNYKETDIEKSLHGSGSHASGWARYEWGLSVDSNWLPANAQVSYGTQITHSEQQLWTIGGKVGVNFWVKAANIVTEVNGSRGGTVTDSTTKVQTVTITMPSDTRYSYRLAIYAEKAIRGYKTYNEIITPSKIGGGNMESYYKQRLNLESGRVDTGKTAVVIFRRCNPKAWALPPK